MKHQTDRTATHHRLARKILLILVLLPFFLGLLLAGISIIAAFQLTTPKRNFNFGVDPSTYHLPYQNVQFPSREDKVSISAWYLPFPGSTQAIILVHGLNASRTHEFHGHFLEFAAALHEKGFTLLMIDLRGHGQGEKAHFSFGLLEQRDVLGGVDWLKTQGFSSGHIGLLGVSMGAASSILAMAQEPGISALVADCGYADINPLLDQEWPHRSQLPHMFLPTTEWMIHLFFGYDVTTARPVDQIDRIYPRPILIIHGDADVLISIKHAYQLKAAAPWAELWVVPRAAHAESYEKNPTAYVKKVANFFHQFL